MPSHFLYYIFLVVLLFNGTACQDVFEERGGRIYLDLHFKMSVSIPFSFLISSLFPFFFFPLPPIPCHISFLTDFLAFQNISFFLFSLLMPHNYNSLFHLHSNDSIFFSFFLSSLPCLLSHLFSFSFFSHDSSISGLNDGSLVILRTSRNTTSISIAGIRP